jgi:hypothetical protein
VQHSQKKRYIAGQYANTNIMRPGVIDGIQDRADAFVKICAESQGASVDIYVGAHNLTTTIPTDCQRFTYTAMHWIALLIISSILTELIRLRVAKILN